jgi:hypothetical protein
MTKSWGRWIERTMDVSEFEDLIDRLSEDMSRWPDGRRVAAEQLLVSSREAQALLEQARTLRQALTAPPVRAPAGLADRIVTAASKLSAEAPRAEDEMASDPARVTHSG